MHQLPDLTDPRYLDEVGWFLYHAKFRRDDFGGSYDQERLAYSRMVLDEVLRYCKQDDAWLRDKTVVTIGCGCTGDLCTWPAAVKIAADPLLGVYQQLGLLLNDMPGVSRTVYLATGIEELPLVDECADLVLCRNALDHMLDPEAALKQFSRILNQDGVLFLSVDIGGEPTPDEPTVFSIESLASLLKDHFQILIQSDHQPPHSTGRVCSLRILAAKLPCPRPGLDKEAILETYLARVERERS